MNAETRAIAREKNRVRKHEYWDESMTMLANAKELVQMFPRDARVKAVTMLQLGFPEHDVRMFLETCSEQPDIAHFLDGLNKIGLQVTWAALKWAILNG